tara:strand:+ start:208 stop:660 length:453 start_codon:yes stop_codon:yes gene_type:complete
MLIDEKLKNILKICAFLAGFIHLKWLFGYISNRGTYIKSDLFNKLIIDIKLFGRKCCSFWPISHFIFYGILTYMFPSKWKEIFVIGFLWEFYEIIMSKIVIENTDIINNDSNIQYSQTWWAAEPLDIFFNTMGILLALLIRHIQKNGKLF